MCLTRTIMLMPPSTGQSNSQRRARRPLAAARSAVLITLAIVVALPVRLIKRTFVLVWGEPSEPSARWIARLEHQERWGEVERKRLPHSIRTAVPWRNGVVTAQYGHLYFIEI